MLIKRRTYFRRMAYAPKLFMLTLSIGRGAVPLPARLRMAVLSTLFFMRIDRGDI